MQQPRPGPTSYVVLDGSQIAYQVTGDGPVDFVYMLGIGTNFERWWEWPDFARMLWRFASFGRLILFDRRGSGISDEPGVEGLPTWERYADDLGAVLDAAGSESAVIMACFDSGPSSNGTRSSCEALVHLRLTRARTSRCRLRTPVRRCR